MSEIREVLGDCANALRNRVAVMATCNYRLSLEKLIARAESLLQSLPAEREAQPSPARVVAWRTRTQRSVIGGWIDGAPTQGDIDAATECRWHIELAYSAPPAVPDGLIEALQRQRQVDEDGTECGIDREAVDVAITILKSLGRGVAPTVPDDVMSNLQTFLDYLECAAEFYGKDARIETVRDWLKSLKGPQA